MIEFKTKFDVGDCAYIVYENQIVKVSIETINITKQKFDYIISNIYITYSVKSVPHQISLSTEVRENALFETPKELVDTLLKNFENKII